MDKASYPGRRLPIAWFFLPFGWALDQQGLVTVVGVASNLIAVSAGNIAGGALLVTAVYWLAYLRGGHQRGAQSS
jgi:formate/nitrite transporter FocA (FNT family)